MTQFTVRRTRRPVGGRLKSAASPTEKPVWTTQRDTTMGKPTEEEFAQALAEAKRMREQAEDTHYVARALLNLNYRNESLVRVLHAAEAYLRSGMAETEHTQLIRAIEQARAVDERCGHKEPAALGL